MFRDNFWSATYLGGSTRVERLLLASSEPKTIQSKSWRIFHGSKYACRTMSRKATFQKRSKFPAQLETNRAVCALVCVCVCCPCVGLSKTGALVCTSWKQSFISASSISSWWTSSLHCAAAFWPQVRLRKRINRSCKSFLAARKREHCIAQHSTALPQPSLTLLSPSQAFLLIFLSCLKRLFQTFFHLDSSSASLWRFLTKKK